MQYQNYREGLLKHHGKVQSLLLEFGLFGGRAKGNGLCSFRKE